MTFLPSPLNTAVTARSTRASYTEGLETMSGTTESRTATSGHTGSRPGTGRPPARTIVRLRGALDVAATPALRERLIGMLHPGISLLVFDLSRVPSCDAAGLAMLIGAQRRAR